MASSGIDPARIDAVRRFNRFYTREIGVLDEGLLHSDFTLAEARLLWELGQAATTATLLAAAMRVDEGYLSRMLRRFESRGLVTRTPGDRDRRQRRVALTARGRAAYRRIDAASRREIGAMLARLPARSQQAIAGAMATIEHALAGDAATPVARLRTLRAGDWGFIVEQHGALYAREFGWDRRFEAMVARIVADIARDFDRTRERCWIAELGGERVGSVCLVRQSATRRQAAPAAARSGGTRARPWPATRARLHDVCAFGGLSPHRAVDAAQPRRGASPLSAGRLPAGIERAQPRIRPRARRRELGARPRALTAV